MNLTTIGTKTIRICHAGSILLGFIAWGMVGPLQAATVWSTEADGSARQFEITCGTCPNPVTPLLSLHDGGFANPSAVVEFAEPDLFSYFATAVFTGPNSLPHLGASATGNLAIVPPSTFFYAATAIARATQLYTYTGSTPEDYTIDYNIDGQISGGLLSQIAGGFTVFGSGFSPGREVQPVLGFSFDHANGDGTEKPVHLTGSVTFSINPGDFVFVQATLDAIVDARSSSMFGSADASHTLAMSFTQGNTALLIPAGITPQASVPEPGSILLTGIGMVGLAIAAPRRRSRAGRRASGRVNCEAPK